MIEEVKLVAHLCSIHNVHFRISMEMHMVNVKENLSGKADLVLAQVPYDVRRDRTDYHTQYDVFGLNDLKVMTKALEDFINYEAHGNVF